MVRRKFATVRDGHDRIMGDRQSQSASTAGRSGCAGRPRGRSRVADQQRVRRRLSADLPDT